MAEFLLRNSLNPYKVIKLGISFSNVVNSIDLTGETIWVVEIGTNEPHKDGGSIAPKFINLISLDDFDKEVEKAVVEISEQVDWTPLLEDSKAPYIYWYSPTTRYVDISTSFKAIIKEQLPSSGIDIDSIRCTVNGFDVTDEIVIQGTPYEYNISWMPKSVVRDTY